MERPTYLSSEKAGCVACGALPIALSITSVTYSLCFPWYVAAAV